MTSKKYGSHQIGESLSSVGEIFQWGDISSKKIEESVTTLIQCTQLKGFSDTFFTCFQGLFS